MTNKWEHEIVANISFSSKTERDDRVIKVAESFGIGLEDKEWTIFKDFTFTVHAGDIVYINGQSGSGKSCLLREAAAQLVKSGLKVVQIDDVEMLDKPIISQIGKSMEDATRLLSLAGISDAYLYIRRPKELSDGQRYRFKLAKLIEQDADVWVADEFGAVLDRVTAKVVAFNLQKLARAQNKAVIVATTHTDLAEELAPNISIYKRFQDRVSVINEPEAGR